MRYTLISVRVPAIYVKELERLVERGLFTSRSEAIRVAVRELLERVNGGAARW